MSLPPPHRVDYSPMSDRPTITWPHNARVVIWVAPNGEPAAVRRPPQLVAAHTYAMRSQVAWGHDR
jgi:hypothetical protein